MIDKKKKLGQFFTSDVIAEFMTNLVVDSNTQELLDPAVGQGVFIKHAKRKNASMAITAYDVDPEVLENCKAHCGNFINYYLEDYLLSLQEKKFDAIICNPPYNRFQNIPNRSLYLNFLSDHFGITISGYANLYVYFLLKSLNELSAKGKCAYIVPYEFLNTGYGTRVKEYLIQNRKLKAIYKFSNSIAIFDETITTSCILFFDSKEHSCVDFILVDSIEQIANQAFTSVNTYSFDDLTPLQKWNCLFVKSEEKKKNLISFNTFAQVKRGIATGNNSFFTLNRQQIMEHKLSEQALIKCVCKSPDVESVIFTEKDFELLREKNKKVFLFDGTKAISPFDFHYIEQGKEAGVDKTYLNSHRNPWFLQENKAVAPIWVSVFNRNKIKFIRNESSAKNLTTFHGIFLRKEYEPYTNILFCYLLTPLSQNILKENKREYGGGLDKFEPNDINHATILDLTVLSEIDRTIILSIYEKIKDNGISQNLIDQLNDIFRKYIE